MAKSPLFDVIEADSYFEIHHKDILKKQRDLVCKGLDGLAEAEGKFKVTKKDKEGK